MDQKMMDRVRALEKRREMGEKVPELDAMYEQIDRREQAGYKAATQPMKPASAASGPVKKMAKGGSASSRADGCAMRGKTRGKLV